MAKRTILVTGCSEGGLGAVLALELHRTGWRVLATARNPAKMSSLAAAGIETLALDVQSQESLLKAIDVVTKLTGGSLDGLINNAGAGYSVPASDMVIEQGKKLFDLNFWSLIATTQAFLPLLLKAESGALLVNHGSVAAVFGLPFQSAYNASKAAVSMLTDNMRLELAPFGIKVVDLRTGVVSTNFHANFEANGVSTKLPENSLYQIARSPVEDVLSGVFDGQHVTKYGTRAEVWAKQVVGDLNKTNPPKVIWRGKEAGLARLATFLPHGTMDYRIKQLGGVDKVEDAVRRESQSK